MFPKDFETAFNFTIRYEGGYVYDPNDPGGETKYGISKRAFPDLDIKNLTIEDAKEIYFKHYYLKGKCDKLPFPLNVVHFDTCVNCGILRASKMLQKAINNLGYKIKIDGIIGPITLSKIELISPNILSLEYIKERVKYYSHLNKLDKFKDGWINRSFALIRNFLIK